jgi:hypothetical protein
MPNLVIIPFIAVTDELNLFFSVLIFYERIFDMLLYMTRL